MPKAAFYILPDKEPRTRDLYVCRITAKAYNNKLTVYIYTDNTETNETINTLLWTFNDISFVPHKIYNNGGESTELTAEASSTPVLIGNVEPPASHRDVLINITDITSPTPNFTTNFSHIIEIIPNEETLHQTAKTRYTQYQQQNYAIVTHDLSKK